MSAALRNMIAHRARLVPLTVEQYDQMIATGTIAECSPIELLDGFLVYKDRSDRDGNPACVGVAHSLAVDLMHEAFIRIRPLGCYLRTQQPIRLPGSEPEP